MNPSTRVYVAGGDTLIGSALIEHFRSSGFQNLVGLPPREPDLTQAVQVEHFFAQARPQVVVMAAGQSGGIEANQKYPADLMVNNLLVSTHVVLAAFRQGVQKLLYLGSSCMYPRDAEQPYRPEALFSGPPEPTSDAYAAAKLTGMKLCQAFRRQYGAPFITAIPANAFGPGDNFRHESGHVIAALMRRMHEAKMRRKTYVEIWGTGKPRRDFIYARDLADACLFVLEHYAGEAPINIGSGSEKPIADIAPQVAAVVGYDGELRFIAAKPDGAHRKSLDSGELFELGWQPATTFEDALRETYAWFLQNHQETECMNDQTVYVSRSQDATRTRNVNKLTSCTNAVLSGNH
ncbi:MAG: GDP-L-fucose synthase [Planctomycetes bacterium]|nr:GDP-L-fucose synthase [Planctomycetota bacterium]